jgi:diguanylate cyclase (GGDEF)-like protein
MTDEKTGLLHHTSFMDRFTYEFEYAQTHGTDLGLLVINLDHFQKFHKTYGPEGADAALARVVELIQMQVRTSDLICRFAGEEFNLLFKQSTRVKTWDIAERIRYHVSRNPLDFQQHMIYLSISIGAVTLRANQAKGIDDLVLMANEALYKAISLGRNRTVMYGESLLFRALLQYT